MLANGGLAALSVRRVAADVGLAVASLRRSFPTQASLRVYCMDLIMQRVQRRIDEIDPAQPVLAFAQDMLCQLLPLDAERRTEMEAFLALGTLGETDPELRTAYERADGLIASACTALVSVLIGVDATADRTALPSKHLHALVDGLALHLLRQPADQDGGWAVAVLDSFLSSLMSDCRHGGHEAARDSDVG